MEIKKLKKEVAAELRSAIEKNEQTIDKLVTNLQNEESITRNMIIETGEMISYFQQINTTYLKVLQSLE